MCSLTFLVLRALQDRPQPAGSLRDLARQTFPRGATLAVQDGIDLRIRVEAGEVWITEEGSAIDLVIAAGETCPLTRRGRALVTVHDSARIALEPMVASAAPRAVSVRTTRDGPWCTLYRGPSALQRRMQRAGAALGALRRRTARLLRLAARSRARRALHARY